MRERRIRGRPAPHLVIFDVDGTLADTNAVDSRCFLAALADVFGIRRVSTDWSRYPHATDSGVLAHVFRSRRGRAPSGAEVAAFRARFLELLAAAAAPAFRPIRGTGELLRALLGDPETAVALASGGWPESAALKLRRAGLGGFDLPGAYGDDAPARELLLALALSRARVRSGTRFRTVVCVGDGVWDARACRTLGLAFVGVATGAAAATLAAEGATSVLRDLAGPEALAALGRRG